MQLHFSDTKNAGHAQLADTPTPTAVVLSCSDSRAPPELIFDQGLGDLYVVRCGAVPNCLPRLHPHHAH